MAERARDRPMSPTERRNVAKVVAAGQRDRDRKAKAEAAYKKALQVTGDKARAERVRAAVLGRKPAVAPLTAKAAKTGKLPSPSLSDPEIRSRLEQAGFVPKIPEGGVVGRFGSDLLTAGVGAVPGTIAAALAVGKDVSAATKGDVSFKRTRKIGSAVGSQLKEDVTHPLRHPGYTFLDALAAVSAGASGAARVSAGGRAASQAGATGGSRVGAALARSPQEGGSLLRRPLPEHRIVRINDMEAQGVYSANPATAAAQKALDKRATTMAEKGNAGPLARKVARLGERNRVIEESVSRAPIVAAQKAGRKLTGAQQVAQRLYMTQTTVDERLALVRKELTAANDPKVVRQLTRETGLLEAARPYLGERGGRVTLRKDFETPRKRAGRRGASPAQLRTQAARDVLGTRTRERQGVEMGLLTEKQIATRRTSEGRVVAGARYEPAAKGKRQVEGQIGVDFARSDLSSSGVERRVARPRTEKEAAARVLELDKAITTRIRPLIDRAFPPEMRQREQLLRNSGAKGKRAQASIRTKLQMEGVGGTSRYVMTDAVAKVETQILRMAEQEGAHPSVKRLAQLIDERDRLKAAIGDAFLREGAGPQAPFGTIEQVRAAKPKRIVMREERRRQAGLSGAEAARPGLAYVPAGSKRARGVVFRPFQSRTGAVPKTSPEVRSSMKEFTGYNVRTAGYRHDTTQAIAESNAAMNRQHQAVRLHDRLKAAGTDVRPQDTMGLKWTPVRTRVLKPGENDALRALTQKLDEGVDLTRQERVAYDRAIADLNDIRPAADALDAPVGATMDGVVWVPKPVFDRVSGAGGQASVPVSASMRVVGRVWHEFAAGMRGAVLYSKGAGAGYVAPNFSANVLLLGFQGGPKLVGAIIRQERRHPRFYKEIGRDALAKLDASMGEGGIVATFTEHARQRGPVSAVTNRVARGLGRVTDVPTRRIAFRYEAWKRGYRTPKQVQALVTDPKHKRDWMDITIRARDAALDYELMHPAERQLLASWLFVYAFLRAATRYSVKFPLDHPYQAAVMGHLARELKENDTLGPRPAYAEGLIQVGRRQVPEISVAALPVVGNANALSPFSQAPDLARTAGAVVGLTKQREFQPFDTMNPALRIAMNSIMGYDPFLEKKLTGSLLSRFGTQTLQQLPIYRDVKAWGPAGDPANLTKKLYPRSRSDIVKGELLGSVAPKPFNPKVAEEQARRDYLAGLPAGKRAAMRVFEERGRFHEWAKITPGVKLDVDGRLPRKLRDAFNIEAERQALYAKAVDGKQTATVEYHLAKYEADLRLLVKHGMVTRDRADEVLANAADATLEELKSARAAISERYYQGEGGPLYYIGHARTVLREAGAPVGG